MTHVDLSGILLKQTLYDSFVKEVCDVLSEPEVTFGDVLSLEGSLVSKVYHFELLSKKQKYDLLTRIFQDAEESMCIANPSFLQKKEQTFALLQSYLQSVFQVVETASTAALAQPVKNNIWGEFLELFHAVTCSSCIDVELPVALPKPKGQLHKEIQVCAKSPVAVPTKTESDAVPTASTTAEDAKSELPQIPSNTVIV
jgi:hypothetical protein